MATKHLNQANGLHKKAPQCEHYGSIFTGIGDDLTKGSSMARDRMGGSFDQAYGRPASAFLN